MTGLSYTEAEAPITECLNALDFDGAFKAFHALYDARFKRWFRLHVHDERAKDVHQEFNLRLHRSLTKFRGQSSVYHWAKRIARRTWIDTIVRAKSPQLQRDATSIAELAVSPVTPRGLIARGAHGPVSLLGMRLPVTLQRFLKHERAGMTSREIASAMAIEVSQVYEMRRNMVALMQAEAQALGWLSRRPSRTRKR